MMRLKHREELRGCRERTSIDQDVDAPPECRFAGLLKSQERFASQSYMSLAVSSWLGNSFRDDEIHVRLCVLRGKTETALPLIDDDVIVVPERCVRKIRQQEFPKLVLSPSVFSNIKD